MAQQERGDKLAEQERSDEIDQRERLDKQAGRDFELEKLRLTNILETNNVASMISAVEQLREKKVNLKYLVSRFDPKTIDVSLFGMLFEGQAQKEEVDETNWVSRLIPLFPYDMAQGTVKEPADKGYGYQHIKKLRSLALKTKFEEHSRKNGML